MEHNKSKQIWSGRGFNDLASDLQMGKLGDKSQTRWEIQEGTAPDTELSQAPEGSQRTDALGGDDGP